MLDEAMKNWALAGELSADSKRLFGQIEAAREAGDSEMGAWLEFFRSLTHPQQQAVLAMIEAIDTPH